MRGDYAFAEDQFRQFIALYPKDPQAPDATNWLGEALLQRQAYDEAADVLLTGFQTYQSSRAGARPPAEARHRARRGRRAGYGVPDLRRGAASAIRSSRRRSSSGWPQEKQKAQCPA